MADRAARDRRPYVQWAEEGFLLTTPGKIVDYAVVVEWIIACCRDWDVRTLFFDPWNVGRLTDELDDIGFPYERDRLVGPGGDELRIVVHPQGFKTAQDKPRYEFWPAMPRSLNNVEVLIARGELHCRYNPLLAIAMLGASKGL